MEDMTLEDEEKEGISSFEAFSYPQAGFALFILHEFKVHLLQMKVIFFSCNYMDNGSC